MQSFQEHFKPSGYNDFDTVCTNIALDFTNTFSQKTKQNNNNKNNNNKPKQNKNKNKQTKTKQKQQHKNCLQSFTFAPPCLVAILN